jgi:hypothetical protein
MPPRSGVGRIFLIIFSEAAPTSTAVLARLDRGRAVNARYLNFAFSAFSEVRREPLLRADVLSILPAALALEPVSILLAFGHDGVVVYFGFF